MVYFSVDILVYFFTGNLFFFVSVHYNQTQDGKRNRGKSKVTRLAYKLYHIYAKKFFTQLAVTNFLCIFNWLVMMSRVYNHHYEKEIEKPQKSVQQPANLDVLRQLKSAKALE